MYSRCEASSHAFIMIKFGTMTVSQCPLNVSLDSRRVLPWSGVVVVCSPFLEYEYFTRTLLFLNSENWIKANHTRSAQAIEKRLHGALQPKSCLKFFFEGQCSIPFESYLHTLMMIMLNSFWRFCRSKSPWRKLYPYESFTRTLILRLEGSDRSWLVQDTYSDLLLDVFAESSRQPVFLRSRVD